MKPLVLSPEVMRRQAEAGWPDHDPEDYCHKCGGRNIPWNVSNAFWNATVRNIDGTTLDGIPESEILCPTCFVEAFNELAGDSTWTLILDGPLTAEMHKRIWRWDSARLDRWAKANGLDGE